MNYKQLIFAREFRGYTQTALAKSIKGLSQSNLSKFEKGFGVLSDEIQNKIMDFLDFPVEFFSKEVEISIANSNYRKKTTISKTQAQNFENKCKLIGLIIDDFSESIDWVDFNFAALNVEEGYSPQYVAQYNRKKIGISLDKPMRNIVSLIESNGIIIYEIDEIEKFDGISFITDKGVPVIIINKNFSNDRKRFTIAHELGHILMHNENNYPVSPSRNKEKEADEFASEFLMPKDAIKSSLRYLKMKDLVDLKSYWLTSMSSIIRRAKDLNCIDKNRYTYFMIEMSRSGFKKKEPVDVYIDNPTCFKNAYNLFKEELEYSTEDFMKYTCLPRDIINEVFSLDNQVKFKTIRLYPN
ncbi:putative Zn peptidase [Bernardetia litoralis DSM 6794]|uniref:Putative Zn peptidase n=1 Tax=Bernardetia litoralis (strain ATCC 23117 / DSM 6794 / NBRC 15988 / NCIMB 1366 / Fx l1 / Sio-4) TaxID=880071 RepID=I4AJ74_BERLS|nr:XRE family transcriptional regulator [Bernardetia litoralis]AFM04009.1 putative Zn peptidase [Bernardetia litoralis DSM 6794]